MLFVHRYFLRFFTVQFMKYSEVSEASIPFELLEMLECTPLRLRFSPTCIHLFLACACLHGSALPVRLQLEFGGDIPDQPLTIKSMLLKQWLFFAQVRR
jgi:hypothetical protein